MTTKQFFKELSLNNIKAFIIGHYLKFIDNQYNKFIDGKEQEIRDKIAQCPQCYKDGACNGSGFIYILEDLKQDWYKIIFTNSISTDVNYVNENLDTFQITEINEDFKHDSQAIVRFNIDVEVGKTYKEEGCGCDWSKLLTDEPCHNKRFK